MSLTRTNDVLTLHYEVGPLRRALAIAAGLAGLGVGVVQSLQDDPRMSPVVVFPAIIVAVVLLGYWLLADSTTTASFDLGRRCVTVTSERPWFGAPRTCAFSDVASLSAVNRSGESVDYWEAILELTSGSRISLGSEVEGANERIRTYLDDIRAATGIAGR